MCPPIHIRLYAALFAVLLLQQCTVNPYSNILFENRSVSDIDSAVVWMQQYRMVFHNIPANTSSNRLVKRDSVLPGGRHFFMRTQVFSQGNVIGQQLYVSYDSNTPDVMYMISFKNDHTIKMHPGSINAIKY